MENELIESGFTGNQGRQAINNAFSASTSFNVLSANTICSNLTYSKFQELQDSNTIMWGLNLGTNAFVTIGGNRTLNITGQTNGVTGTIVVKQDSSGGRTLSLTSSTYTNKIINGGGGYLLLTSEPNSIDILSFIYKDSVFYWNIGFNYN